jgi:exonuclease SbcC
MGGNRLRPLKLTISAFGPYAGKTVIELEKLGEKGLYLITGDTGSGKTTIFDAVTFALYGEPSGKVRETSMLRSKYAAPYDETYVEMVFKHGEKTYAIWRNPEYMRPKKKGEGYIRQTPDAVLTNPDGSIISGYRQVNEAVVNLLGVDRRQFTQIAMIAQGDFLKLLIASTEERKAIFRQIFCTAPYQALQERLKSDSQYLKNKYEDLEKSIKQYINGVKCHSDSFQEELEKAKEGKIPLFDTLSLINMIIEEDEKLLNDVSLEREIVAKEVEENIKTLKAFEQQQMIKKELLSSEKALEEAKEKLLQLEENSLEQEAQRPALDKITGEIATIYDKLPRYDLLDELLGAIKKMDKSICDKVDSLANLEGKYIQSLNKLSANKAQLLTLTDTEANIATLKAEENSCRERLERILALQNLWKEYKDKLEMLEASRQSYIRARERAEDAALEFERKNKAFLDAQAGILACDLQPGKPCPVCGSKSHPQPAEMPKSAPEEKEVEMAKRKAQDAQKSAALASEAAAKLNGEIQSRKQEIINALQPLAIDYNPDKLEDGLIAEQEKLENRLENLTSSIEAEHRRKEKKNLLEKDISLMEQAVISLQQEIEKEKTDVATLKAELKAQKEQKQRLKSELAFESKDCALEYLKKLEQEKANISRVINLAKEALDEQNRLCREFEGKINTLLGQFDADFKVDEKELLAQKGFLSEKMKQADDKTLAISVRLNSNKEAFSSIQNLQEQAAQIQEHWAWVKALSDTANGALAGKDKIMLETYVQTFYFDRIIRRANLRFLAMSGGQYELVRNAGASDKKSQSGLDLNVIDHYNATERSVKTLSGGESFMASLSLALGLSDEIQSSSAGIRLDGMFVDEGFGSLDEGALNQAVRVLGSIAQSNLLIGIISHVPELKERIEKQIVVTKDKSGGSKAEILV